MPRARTKARKRALDILFESEARGDDPRQVLVQHAEGWTVARMPAVDRNLLRIGVFEMLWVDEIDDPVAITEAVELARTLSTDDSPRFLNGVLSRIADLAVYLRAGR